MMTAGIFYFGGCFVVAALITFIYGMFRSVQSRDEWKSWQTFSVLFVICVIGPYGWAEAATKMAGDKLRKSVRYALSSANIEGDLQYYKVITNRDNRVSVIAVSSTTENWGGTNRAVISLQMKKDGENYRATSFKVVNSDQHNKDGFTFPPYF
jgi:hypothetical protein